MKKLLFILPLLFLAGCATYENVEVVEEPPVVEETTVVEVAPEPIWFQVVPRLKQEFVDKYKYEDSKWFCVALKINGQYFKTFRNGNNWVSNSKKHWLDWCIPMNQISRGYDTESPDYRTWAWTIYYDQEYGVAKKPDNYGFVYATYTKEMYTWLTIWYSPVKEDIEYIDIYVSEIFE